MPEGMTASHPGSGRRRPAQPMLGRFRLAKTPFRVQSLFDRSNKLIGDKMTNAEERQAVQSTGGHTARPHADRAGLPAWSYFSAELLEAEKDALFRRHWQVICHASDIPAPGDFITCDIVGDRALILRDGQGAIRAFHNLCRHRGHDVGAQAAHADIARVGGAPRCADPTGLCR